MHNETTNIWSHLIGFICMSVAGINVSIDLFSKGTSLSEIFAIELYIFSACSCLLLSTIYHWFGCLSEQCHHCFLRFDLTGVALLVSGSFLPGVFYGIKCTYA
jgi:adiponectin receptor